MDTNNIEEEKQEKRNPVYLLDGPPELDEDITIEQRIHVSRIAAIKKYPKENIIEVLQRMVVHNYKLMNAIDRLLANWPTEVDTSQYESVAFDDEVNEVYEDHIDTLADAYAQYDRLLKFDITQN